ncbi:MAG: hypothetical protein MUF54_18760, partial [Polyangiaceae bacterium]|nr:hypothetical protein [Polyangiaceae bacterium]
VYVDYVVAADGVPFVVERRLASEWLVSSNSHRDGEDIVLQAVRERDGKALLEYRFPADGGQAGHYARSLRYARPKGSARRFRARRASAQLKCRLVRVKPRTGAPLGDGARALPLLGPGDDGTEAEVQGWGSDRRSFRAGDRMLIQVQGRAVAARVLRATRRAYLMRCEGAPEDAGIWVEPSRIVGRFEWAATGNSGGAGRTKRHKRTEERG